MWFQKKTQNVEDNTKWIEWMDRIGNDLSRDHEYFGSVYPEDAEDVANCMLLLSKCSTELNRLLPFHSEHERRIFESKIVGILKKIDKLKNAAFDRPFYYGRDIYPELIKLYDLIIKSSTL